MSDFKISFQRLSSVLLFIPYYTIAFSAVSVGFIADATEGCGPGFEVNFTNTETNASYSYQWYVDGSAESTNQDFNYTFLDAGEYMVQLITTNTSTSEKDSITETITVYRAYSVINMVNTNNSCINGVIRFNTSNSSSPDSVVWDFNDGTTWHFTTPRNIYDYSYSANGSYDVEYRVYDHFCADTARYTVDISGPHAEILVSPESACKGQEITFTMNPIADVNDFLWTLDTLAGIHSTNNPATHTYDYTGQLYVYLNLNGATKSCTIQDTIDMDEVLADFTINEATCHQDTFRITNVSLGNNQNFWTLNGSSISFEASPELALSSGTYDVGLKVIHADGCADSTQQQITVNALPVLSLSEDATICPGETATLSVEGGEQVSWSPMEGLDSPLTPSTLAQPDTNTVYTATVTLLATGCTNSDSIRVSVQQGFETGYITLGLYDSVLIDSSLIVGDSIGVWLTDSLNRNLSYSWTPEYRISCIDCPNPILSPLEETEYIIEISDSNQCFATESFHITIPVREEYYLGVVAAFTPNGDFVNDLIGVDGWGIQEVKTFQIFNRNGNQVFSGSGNRAQWDGMTNNQPQPSGTYMYRVVATMWDDSEMTKRGTFNLIR